jgi:DNA-binding transcriptional LysR family regulator
MELRQFEYFVCVAEEASFTKAAARLHIAQPGVSAQIRHLERELGQDLFDRSGRAVRLTEAGTAVLLYARAALGAAAGARLVVDELTGLVRGHVAVGMVVACSSYDLANLLADFHRDTRPSRSPCPRPTPMF